MLKNRSFICRRCLNRECDRCNSSDGGFCLCKSNGHRGMVGGRIYAGTDMGGLPPGRYELLILLRQRDHIIRRMDYDGDHDEIGPVFKEISAAVDSGRRRRAKALTGELPPLTIGALNTGTAGGPPDKGLRLP